LQHPQEQASKNLPLPAHGLNPLALRLSWLNYGVQAVVALVVRVPVQEFIETAVVEVVGAHIRIAFLKLQTLQLQ
jgi:hypothetical protein